MFNKLDLFQISDKNQNDKITVDLKIDDSTVRFRVDTWSDTNIIDKNAYDKLQEQPDLVTYKQLAFAYNQPTSLESIGKFSRDIEFKGQCVSCEFIVMKGGGGLLLSKKASTELKIVEFRWWTNHHQILGKEVSEGV